MLCPILISIYFTYRGKICVYFEKVMEFCFSYKKEGTNVSKTYTFFYLSPIMHYAANNVSYIRGCNLESKIIGVCMPAYTHRHKCMHLSSIHVPLLKGGKFVIYLQYCRPAEKQISLVH